MILYEYHNSMHKYGYNNFSVGILAFPVMPTKDLRVLEYDYITELEPNLNILKLNSGYVTSGNSKPVISNNLETGDRMLFPSIEDAASFFNCSSQSVSNAA